MISKDIQKKTRCKLREKEVDVKRKNLCPRVNAEWPKKKRKNKKNQNKKTKKKNEKEDNDEEEEKKLKKRLWYNFVGKKDHISKTENLILQRISTLGTPQA